MFNIYLRLFKHKQKISISSFHMLHIYLVHIIINRDRWGYFNHDSNIYIYIYEMDFLHIDCSSEVFCTIFNEFAAEN